MVADKTLTCRHCGATFPFTAGEQMFYMEKGFLNEPTRCPSCRKAHKGKAQPQGGVPSFEVACAACGAHVLLPFVPRPGSPIYCSDCFARHRG